MSDPVSAEPTPALSDVPARRTRMLPRRSIWTFDPALDPILAALVRLGPMTTDQLRRIGIDRSVGERSVQRWLKPLTDAGFAMTFRAANPYARGWYRHPAPTLGYVYVATEAGVERVQAQYPDVTPSRRWITTRLDRTRIPQLAHALAYSELVIAILELLPAVRGYINVYSESEYMLWQELSPRADGILVMRHTFHAPRATPKILRHPMVAWMGGSRQPNEPHTTYALEVDNASENPVIIRAKAQSYMRFRRAFMLAEQGRGPPTNLQLHGFGAPIVIWVTPTRERRDAVYRAWRWGVEEHEIDLLRVVMFSMQDIHAYGLRDAPSIEIPPAPGATGFWDAMLDSQCIAERMQAGLITEHPFAFVVRGLMFNGRNETNLSTDTPMTNPPGAPASAD